jgi:ribonuclease HI
MADDVVEIYSDGACRGNPGPGGWGAVLRYKGKEKELYGGEAATTNNRMELLAVAMVLETAAAGRPIHIQADSSYVIDALTKWRHGWKRRGWKTASGDAVKNLDLIEQLDVLVSERMPTFEWVRGHAGHLANEAADLRARAAAEAVDAGLPWLAGPGFA